MKYFKYLTLPLAVACMSVASDVQGQSLFAKPDTSPNYSSYQHIEECMSAVRRITDIEKSLKRETIWWDTIAAAEKDELKKKLNFKDDRDQRRPESAIKAINGCLEKFNPDTVKILSGPSAIKVIKTLLAAHRDDDAARFAKRFLDSLKRESEKAADPVARKKAMHNYKDWFYTVGKEYRAARPGRLDVARQYFTQLLSMYKADGDSLYYSIDIALDLVFLAERIDDTVAAESARQLAIQLNDSTPEQERRGYPGANNRLPILAGIVLANTRNDALDSIAISNVAYNLWYANTVKRRIYGGDIVTKDDESIQPKKLPELTGEYYYIANSATTPGTLDNDKPTYVKKGAVPSGELPKKNTINYVVALPTFCQVETEPRGEDDGSLKLQVRGDACLGHAANIRALKRQFPDMEIIGLTNTYGTVGQLGPLTPDQNADTLAKLFLEFHRLPVRLVVENTEVFHMSEPDGRRIDMETPNSQELGNSVKNNRFFRLTDKDSYIIAVSVSSTPDWFKKFYEILKNRPVKQ